MTARERIGATLRHERPDRIPWTPNIWHWFKVNQRNHTLPDGYEDCETAVAVLKRVGADIFDRWDGGCVRETTPNIEVVEKIDGAAKTITYKTPKGELESKEIKSSAFDETMFRSRI